MLKISILVICVIICWMFIKKEEPSFVMVIVLVTCVIISISMIRSFSIVTGYISVLINNVNIEKGYIKIIFKITGLSIVTQFVSDICKDNGFNAIASQLELLCRISIVLISMPVIVALLEMVNECLK